MADREKVMQWLETCANGCEDGCPYEYKNLVYKVECKADLMSDALELLKEQEAKQVVGANEFIEGMKVGHCPSCNRSIVNIKSDEAKFCKYCGQAVKWHD